MKERLPFSRNFTASSYFCGSSVESVKGPTLFFSFSLLVSCALVLLRSSSRLPEVLVLWISQLYLGTSFISCSSQFRYVSLLLIAVHSGLKNWIGTVPFDIRERQSPVLLLLPVLSSLLLFLWFSHSSTFNLMKNRKLDGALTIHKLSTPTMRQRPLINNQP